MQKKYATLVLIVLMWIVGVAVSFAQTEAAVNAKVEE